MHHRPIRFIPNVVFLDRDGTIIRDTSYLSDPDHVELLDGVAESVARLNRRGIPVIVATNQSGIGRGLFTVSDYESVRERLDALLAAHGAHLDASYYCPHAPETPCECRKPRAGMFRQALREHLIPPGTPLLIGDRWRDIAPARELGGVGILISSQSTPAEDIERAKREASLASTLADALDRVLSDQ